MIPLELGWALLGAAAQARSLGTPHPSGPSSLVATLDVAGALAPPVLPAPGVGTLWLRAPLSRSAYLPPAELSLGSSDDELVLALLACQREPLPDRCDEFTFANERPLARKVVGSFWLARTETRVLDYERCVEAGRCQAAGFVGPNARFGRPDYPVTQVSFADARNYCEFVGGRLPSAAEFERAARGPQRRLYPWGNAWNSRLANHGRLGVDETDDGDGFGELAPVGSFPAGATPEGVLDLAGNVAEWTTDDDSRARRSVRGGSFASARAFLRGAAHTFELEGTRRPTIGFRCAWSYQTTRD